MTKETKEDNVEKSAAATLVASIGRNSWLLGIFSLLCTAIIAATHWQTADQIAVQKRQAKLKALYQIVPRDQHDNDLLGDSRELMIEALGHNEAQRVFLARQNTVPHTLIYPVTTPQGYSGDINLLVGINIKNSTISGVRVVSHRETPGLGDKIEQRKSPWILSFNGRSLGEPDNSGWTVKKDGGAFDGFTGATITPRAVVHAVASTLQYHQQQAETLLLQFPHQSTRETSR